MTELLTAHSLSKSFSDRPLFADLSLTLLDDDHVGLIGPNGAGKSTLLEIIAENMDPDTGHIARRRGLRVGYLCQNPIFPAQATLLSAVLSNAPAQASPREANQRASEFLSRLDLQRFGPETPVTHLSGGSKKRLALAMELMKDPALLLLDEPTNHLDIESILWLENFLSSARFAFLTITHDRLFLERIANRVIEINPRFPGGLLSVEGPYSHFLDVKEQRLSAQEKQELTQKNILRRETQWLRQGAKARTTKQQARIKRAGDLKETVEDLTIRNRKKRAQLEFETEENTSKKLLEAKRLSQSYDGRIIFSDFNIILGPGSRIGLLGPNGIGKSTLIRTLIGEIKPATGTVIHAESLRIAYFDQIREKLDVTMTVKETLCPGGDHVIYQGKSLHITSYLDRFLFRHEHQRLTVGQLSGGEQSRLLLARLMLQPANLLVLDEPTNDLDLQTLEVLEQCFIDFPGAIILVSHDRFFLDQVCNRLFAFPPEKNPNKSLIPFADYYQWEIWHAAQMESDPTEKQPISPSTSPKISSDQTPSPLKKLTYKDQFELEGMEAAIQKLENELAALTLACGLPENMASATKLSDIAVRMGHTQSEIDRLYARWQELEARVIGLAKNKTPTP